MQLSIETLKQAGAFTGRPVRKEITWTQADGDQTFTATVYVRPLGYQTAVSDVLAAGGKQDSIAGRIAASICDEEGRPVFTVLDITHGPLDPEALAKDPESTQRLGALDGNLSVALLYAIHEVNTTGKMSPSPNSTSSGTKSPARSARQSLKRKSA
ncbi:phage tail assembly chaperone family protein, TAC [Pseudomonas panipatensis]|uniref:Phage tail assembly chaperone, TAC n=1 Tax=Pseudomonas panipatensis TaxID=428992 RepID=A0A1G8HKL6_9PSED|nr:phage tail assembly chaperone family protein, TAC [Pseudomonas panipatensis]SDI07198.1 Phage tail assembly chaperone, TAC [Pseudomonas panipatensis]SMP58890.1 Phage tail assembly chaperone, TAC [Pseudomonas panipatensis]